MHLRNLEIAVYIVIIIMNSKASHCVIEILMTCIPKNDVYNYCLKVLRIIGHKQSQPKSSTQLNI